MQQAPNLRIFFLSALSKWSNIYIMESTSDCLALCSNKRKIPAENNVSKQIEQYLRQAKLWKHCKPQARSPLAMNENMSCRFKVSSQRQHLLTKLHPLFMRLSEVKKFSQTISHAKELPYWTPPKNISTSLDTLSSQKIPMIYKW